MSTTTSSPIPLTTTFTPPSSCISELWWISSSDKKWMNLGPTDAACLPSGWATSSYFSPGICPSKYGVAKTMLIDSGSSTETVATCCPIAESHTYSLRPTTTTGSQSELKSEVCVWGPAPNVIYTYTYTWSGTDGSKASTTGKMTSPGYFNAFGIEIRWRSADFSGIPATASATTTPQFSPTSRSQDSTGPDSSSGLSSGGKAGIGVGVAAGVVAVAILGLFFWFRRQKAQQVSSVSMSQNSPNAYPPNMYDLNAHVHDMHGGGEQVAELSTARNEPFTYPKAELAAETEQRRLAELE